MAGEVHSFFTRRSEKKAPTNLQERKGGTKRKIIDDEDDDIEIVENKRNTAKKEKKEELEDVEVSTFFGSRRNVRSNDKKQEKKEEKKDDLTIIDDVDDEILQFLSSNEVKKDKGGSGSGSSRTTSKRKIKDEDEDDPFEDEIVEVKSVKVKSSPKKVESPSKRKVVATKVPAPKVSAPKVPAKSSTTKSTKGAAASNGPSANDILAQIPDAILPEIDTSKKFNFHAHQSKVAETSQPEGPIEIPDAAENCLAGLTFVFTGIMPTLSRTQGQDLVKKYGGKVTGQPSRNTSCVVLGAEAGPKKIENIKKLNIKAIDESGFLDLLSKMPADGGSGDAAKKAMEKKRIEELKVEEEVKKMTEEMSRKEEEAVVKAKAAAAAASTSPSPLPSSIGKSKSIKNEPNSSSMPSSSPRIISENEKLWTSKYAPTELSQICGNKGAVDKLALWLANWKKNSKNNFKGNFMDPNTFRAAIIHGPPGIGKTTVAHLIAKRQGFDVIENNASDTRSKTLLQNNVSKTLDNTSLLGTFAKRGVTASKSKRDVCLIMDEVDGMSAGDRGGVGAMAALCKTTNIPIILICNERSLPKMRPFDRATYDIPFRRPDARAITPRIMAIAAKEGIKLEAGVVDQLVQSTHSDIRQIINLLSTFSTTNKVLDFDTSKKVTKQWEKQVILKPFDIVGKLLSGSTFAPANNVSLNDKIELYFNDHDFAPLMVQENYLSTHPSKTNSTKGGALELASKAAQSISDGDLVDKMIHGTQQQWSLMPLHGVLSCVKPSYYVAGQASGRFNFAGFLGNNSKAGKYNRLLQELQSHARLKLWGDKLELRLQYLPLLTYKLINPLIASGAEGIEQVIAELDEYYLTKEDWDVIMELGVGSLSYEPKAKALPTAVKSSFTRKYNSMDHPMPYMKSFGMSASEAKVISKPDKPDIEDVIEDDVEIEEEEEKVIDDNEELTKNKYINIPKAKGKGKAKPKAPAKPRAKKK